MATNNERRNFFINLFVFAAVLPTLFCACSKTTAESPIVLAEYSLGTGGDCTGATVSGRYVADTAVTGLNTVAITVDVTVAGAYWITTNAVNGISFSQISTFPSTGPQTAVLTATGTPVATETSTFTVTALNGLGGNCTFSVATVLGVQPVYYLTCSLDGVYRNFSDSAAATNSSNPGNSGSVGLDVTGLDTVMNSNSKVEFGVINLGSVGAGSYTDTSFAKAYFIYIDGSGETWSVNTTGTPSFNIAVTVASSRNIEGKFSGTIKNQQGTGTDSIVVTNGVFNVPIK